MKLTITHQEAELQAAANRVRELEAYSKIREDRISGLMIESTDRAEKIRELVPDYMKQWAPLDAVRVICSERDEMQKRLRRFTNPWTIEILNQSGGHWSEFCHDAPITLAEAEKRVMANEHPDAKLRVAPWFNLDQRQVVQRERMERDRALSELDEAEDKISALESAMNPSDVVAAYMDWKPGDPDILASGKEDREPDSPALASSKGLPTDTSPVSGSKP